MWFLLGTAFAYTSRSTVVEKLKIIHSQRKLAIAKLEASSLMPSANCLLQRLRVPVNNHSSEGHHFGSIFHNHALFGKSLVTLQIGKELDLSIQELTGQL